MAINTVLLDLSLDPTKITEKHALVATIEEVLSKFIAGIKEVHSCNFGDKGFLAILTGARDSFVTVRGFPPGLVSINVEYYDADDDRTFLPFVTVRRLEEALTKATGSAKSHKYPAMKRGDKVDRYFLTIDERITELDVDDVVFEEQSPHQKVQILHSKSVGNLLVLDELQNMSERDLVYTDKLMQKGTESYFGKEIVILGGGDGGLLCELLKENPKFVTMLELDEVVIKACRQHLRGCCGTCLDQYESSNYKIVIGDCIKSLDAVIASGRKVDYVFGDLTDTPLSSTPQEDLINFTRLVLKKSMQVLNPSGKYMTHGNSVSSLAMYEDLLGSLAVPVEITKETAFIPSFLEYWVFYQVGQKKLISPLINETSCD